MKVGKYRLFGILILIGIGSSNCCRMVNPQRISQWQQLGGNVPAPAYQTLLRYLGEPAFILEVELSDRASINEKVRFCYRKDQKRKLSTPVMREAEINAFSQQFESKTTFQKLSDLSLAEKARLNQGEYYLIDDAGNFSSGCFCAWYFSAAEDLAWRNKEKE